MVVDKGGEGEEVEQVGKESPYIGVPVFSETLIVESIHLGDLPRLMVASEDGDSVAIAQLHRYKQGNSFNGVVATVDVVAHEEVICVWRIAADSEQF